MSEFEVQRSEAPSEIEQAALTNQLGPLQAEYATGFTRGNAQGVLIGLAWVVLFAIGRSAISSDGPNAGLSVLSVLLVVVGLLIVAWNILSPVFTASWRVYVYRYGFIFTKGNQPEVYRLDQIRAFWREVTDHYTNGRYSSTSHKYTVESDDGRKVAFDDHFKEVEHLGDWLRDNTAAYILPKMQAVLNAEGVVSFGFLAISSQGIVQGKELLPWSEIKEIDLSEGRFIVKEKGGWLSWSSLRAADIPNFAIFCAMIEAGRDNVQRNP